MRLEKYLLEYRQYNKETRSKDISEEEAIKIVKTKCKQAVKIYTSSNTRIYRGLYKSGLGYYRYVEPSKFKRLSANINNYYTLMIDNFKAWSKYPKRSKSIVCTTDANRACMYSHCNYPFVVFPFDGAKIGVCPEFDIWDTYVDVDSFIPITLDQLTNELERQFIFSYGSHIFEWSDFKKACKELDKDKKNIDYGGEILTEYFLDEKIKLIEWLEKLFTPKKCKFKLININQMKDDRKEVWTDANSVLISGLLIDEFMKKIL